MKNCCICNLKSKAITYHKFPKNELLLQKWKEACGFESRDVVTTLYICTKHFRLEDYVEPNAKLLNTKMCLKPNTVPSINVPVNTRKRKVKQGVESPVEASTFPTIINANVNNPKWSVVGLCEVIEEGCAPEEQHEKVSLSTKTVDTAIHEGAVECSSNRSIVCGKIKRKFFQPRYMNEVIESDFTSPTRARIAFQLAKAQAKKFQRKYEVTRQQVIRLKKKVKSLTGMVTHLRDRNLLSSTACEYSGNSE